MDAMIRQSDRVDAACTAKARGLARCWRKSVPLIAALALGLALAGCDKCGDFFWQQRQPGTCHGAPAPS